MNDALVLLIICSPLLVFLAALYVLVWLYDNDPPLCVLRRWWWRREREIFTARCL